MAFAAAALRLAAAGGLPPSAGAPGCALGRALALRARAPAAWPQAGAPSAFAEGSRRGFAAAGGGRRPTAAERRAEQWRRGTERARTGAVYLAALTVGMVGLTYAAVPLYRMFCQATGYGGTTKRLLTLEDKLADRRARPREEVERAAAQREVTVRFNADVVEGVPWKFRPTQRSVRVSPGESTLAFYTVKNNSDKPVIGVSTYNVSPQQAGQYFNKIQCFCFEEQRLLANEELDMPVFFYIDPEFATDPYMDGIDTITLSYTFFSVDESEVADVLRDLQAQNPHLQLEEAGQM